MTSNAEHNDAVRHAAQNFADHERMNEAHILRWVNQFDIMDHELAVKILDKIKYFGASRIRGMTLQLVDIALQYLANARTSSIFFVAVGEDYEGSRVVVRALRDIKRQTNGDWQIRTMTDLVGLKADDVDAIVFVDDFSGTGNKLCNWWRLVEAIVLPKHAQVIIGLLVMNYLANDRISEFADETLFVLELNERDNALSTESEHFEPDEQQALLRYCRKTGAPKKYSMGYGSCGLLIAFKHACPNNSIPVLWWNSDDWNSLFQRSAL